MENLENNLLEEEEEDEEELDPSEDENTQVIYGESTQSKKSNFGMKKYLKN